MAQAIFDHTEFDSRLERTKERMREEDLDVKDGRIGVEMDAYYFTAKAYTRL